MRWIQPAAREVSKHTLLNKVINTYITQWRARGGQAAWGSVAKNTHKDSFTDPRVVRRHSLNNHILIPASYKHGHFTARNGYVNAARTIFKFRLTMI